MLAGAGLWILLFAIHASAAGGLLLASASAPSPAGRETAGNLLMLALLVLALRRSLARGGEVSGMRVVAWCAGPPAIDYVVIQPAMGVLSALVS